MGINGEGIGYHNRKPVFVADCFPGETVEVKITERNDRYYKGECIKIYKPSPSRITPECTYSDKCGACSLIKMDYTAQQKYKKELIKEAFLKYTEIKPNIKDLVAADEIFGYRNKCNLPVINHNGTLTNAIYRRDSNKPVVINNCLIHNEQTEKVRKDVLRVLNEHGCSAYDSSTKKGIRQLMVRSLSGQSQIVLVTGHDEFNEDLLNDLFNIESVVSIYQGINVQKDPVQMVPDKLKLLKGQDEIRFEICGIKVRLLPQSFFQLNYDQCVKLYNLVSKLAQKNNGLMIEAYCGVGIMSLMLAQHFNKVIGIEIVPEAVKNAKKMAEENKINNVEFYCDDVCKVIGDITTGKTIDVLLVDPPRTGLDEIMLDTILKADINSIIYVSCNPATLAKDINKLSERFSVKEIHPIDMFPNTPHVETVVLMSRVDR